FHAPADVEEFLADLHVEASSGRTRAVVFGHPQAREIRVPAGFRRRRIDVHLAGFGPGHASHAVFEPLRAGRRVWQSCREECERERESAHDAGDYNSPAMAAVTLTVNGKAHRVDVDPDCPLLYVLRDTLELNNPRFGCGLGQCGACTVLVENRAV